MSAREIYTILVVINTNETLVAFFPSIFVLLLALHIGAWFTRYLVHLEYVVASSYPELMFVLENKRSLCLELEPGAIGAGQIFEPESIGDADGRMDV